MLLDRRTLDGIAAGEVTFAFRRWRRPTVRAGGTLRTAVGVLAIDAVGVIDREDISEHDARRAGFPSRAALLAWLDERVDGGLYRIAFHVAGPDPRAALRERSDLTAVEWDRLIARLERLDRASGRGAWTRATLALIAERPATRASDLAAAAGVERLRFKSDVRKLKELGLTESLEVGYRLSPRGQGLLRRLSAEGERGAAPTRRRRQAARGSGVPRGWPQPQAHR